MRTLLAMTVIVYVGLMSGRGTTGQEKQKSTLKEDRKKLEGLWKTEGWRKEGAKGWQCHAAVSLEAAKFPHVSLTINFEFEGTMPPNFFGSAVELKEKDGKRWLEVSKDVAKNSGLPTQLFYHLDGDLLTLAVTEGVCKGEYKLKHYKQQGADAPAQPTANRLGRMQTECNDAQSWDDSWRAKLFVHASSGPGLHVIADLSIHHVEGYILNQGHTTQRLGSDYGYDLIMWTFDERGYVEPGAIYFQVKAMELLIESGPDYVYDLDIRDYHLWTREEALVVLILYDAGRRRGYWLPVMKRSEVTYGQLDRALRALGFSCQPSANEPPGRIYQHPKTGAVIRLPAFSDGDKVYAYHMLTVQGELDNFGIADPKSFAAELKLAG